MLPVSVDISPERENIFRRVHKIGRKKGKKKGRERGKRKKRKKKEGKEKVSNFKKLKKSYLQTDQHLNQLQQRAMQGAMTVHTELIQL